MVCNLIVYAARGWAGTEGSQGSHGNATSHPELLDPKHWLVSCTHGRVLHATADLLGALQPSPLQPSLLQRRAAPVASPAHLLRVMRAGYHLDLEPGAQHDGIEAMEVRMSGLGAGQDLM